MPQPKFQFLISLLVYTVIVRLLPYVLMNCDIQSDPSVLYYPWNFSPLTAVCLFGGAFLASRRMSFVLPLATLLISDVVIALVSGHPEWGFPLTPEGTFTMARFGRWVFTYACFGLAVVLGSLLKGQKPKGLAAKALALGLSFEVVFFLASNFLVWTNFGMSEAPIYPMTFAGLLTCYYVALPFVVKSLLGTTAFTLLLFSPLAVRAATESDGEQRGKLAHVRVK